MLGGSRHACRLQPTSLPTGWVGCLTRPERVRGMGESAGPEMGRRHHAGAAEVRRERATVRRTLGSRVISVANLVGAPVRNPDGIRVGKVSDVVVRWDGATSYPLVVGVLVRTGRVLGVVPISDLFLGQSAVQIRTTAVVVAVPVRGDGRMALSRDVIDRQLIDVAGVQVVRAADAYLAD